MRKIRSISTLAALAAASAVKGPYTVFAPTDAACSRLPKATLDAVGQDKAKLRSVLL